MTNTLNRSFGLRTMQKPPFDKRYKEPKIVGDIIPDVLRELEKIREQQKQIKQLGAKNENNMVRKA